ncbi:hypothetical protein FDG56_gp130 [Mycobacterium phage Bask21]|uniref:Uncharacterized protein n=1 Tax=Mycobacterium phage Bask21 TaxID=2902889 RepID=G1D0X4_9CAUD|nr:hypothetical protein FDG56_gp130 [Mycobacterium phage Bask21]AEK08420.1 hypothetical protein PBI_BASK21_126 [Mycobacterium phage Bask21]
MKGAKCFPCLMEALEGKDELSFVELTSLHDAVTMIAGTAVCQWHARPKELDDGRP